MAKRFSPEEGVEMYKAAVRGKSKRPSLSQKSNSHDKALTSKKNELAGKMKENVSVLKRYAARERESGRGDEYAAHRSMIRKLHSIKK